jgi:hypothetical protein
MNDKGFTITEGILALVYLLVIGGTLGFSIYMTYLTICALQKYIGS